MIVPYIDGLMLYLITALKGERTIYSPLHILNGKKSSQPIQDARLFNIAELFGVLPKLDRKTWDQKIIELIKKGYIQEVGNQTYICTDQGKSALTDWKREYPALNHLNGRKYQDKARGFWMRLQLLVQTSSCLLNGNHAFIPVSRNQEDQLIIKKLLKKIRLSPKELGRMLFKEIEEVLSNVQETSAELIVLSFSGHQRAGLTIPQAAQKLNIDLFYARLLFWDTVHYMLEVSEQSSSSLLHELMQSSQSTESYLTASAFTTLKMLESGLSKEEVATIRKLKVNTVEDHLVEIVSNVADYPIDVYVNRREIEQIEQAITSNKTKQLRTIKQVLPPEITYFKIRLVMAKMKEV